MENSANTSSIEDVSRRYAVSIFFTSVMALLSLAAVIGNILVFVTVVKIPSLRTSTNFYYVNMAISDFICSLTTWPLYLTDEIITNRGSLIQGPLATIGCQAGVFVRNVSHSVSLLSLLLIAVDRYIATVFPLKATRLTKKIRGAFLLSTWILAIGCCLPTMYYSKVESIGHETFCILALNTSSIAVYYAFCLFMLIGILITIIILYSRIMRVLKRRLKARYGAAGSSAEHKRNRDNHNVMKIFRSILVAFIVCWFLFGIYLILKIIFPELFTRDKCKLILGFSYYVFPMLSTVMNPVILFTFSSNFRYALKELLSFSLKKCMPSCKTKKVLPDKEQESNKELVAFKVLQTNEAHNMTESITLQKV